MKDLGSSAAFLADVEAGLALALQPEAGGELLAEAGQHLVLAPDAKRLRPLFVHEAGVPLGVAWEALVDLAVAAELVHSASLLHDDVVDRGQVRRARATVNARYGNSAAVLAGDWLLTVALGRLESLPRAVSTRAVHVVAEMSRAAMWEVEARGRLDGGLAEWRRIAEGKTGVLFGFCGWAANVIAGRDDDAAALDRFGRHLGVAFQLADDLNDVSGDEVAKDRFSDIRAGAPSYPLLVAAQRSPAFAERLQAAWALPERSSSLVQSLGAMALATGAGDASQRALHDELDAALTTLGTLVNERRAAGVVAIAEAFRLRLKQRAA